MSVHFGLRRLENEPHADGLEFYPGPPVVAGAPVSLLTPPTPIATPRVLFGLWPFLFSDAQWLHFTYVVRKVLFLVTKHEL